ncbi:MAG: nucleotide exchange factor GrpE [Anaerolineales bacterium]|nr:nucleotide exchange factor GrpE [Anaerolineales bacterium]
MRKKSENQEEVKTSEPVESEQEAQVMLNAELETLRLELAETRAKAEEYLDGWQRARAEFANYKKRQEREQAQAYQTTSGNIIKRYLEVIDDLERALKNRPQGGDGESWANGIELVYRKLLAILESEGVKPMGSQGQVFDPAYHEAITSEENDHFESGQIIEVVKQGYLLGDRVLRPALVRVAR